MKFALFTVSYSGIWYKGEPLMLREQIKKAKKLGFDGISIEARRPVASPLDLNKAERRAARELADSEGIEICALEANNDFASPVVESRENNLLMTRAIIEMANDMDVKLVKIFASWPGITMKDGLGSYEFARHLANQTNLTNDERWSLALEGIKESAKWAKEYGVVLALQNHPEVVRFGYEDVLKMVKLAGQDNVKLCLDVPLFDKQDDQYVKEAVQECKDLIVLSHYGSWDFRPGNSGEVIQLPMSRTGTKANYKTFVRELQNIGYQGFLAQEECEPVMADNKYLGIEEVDRRVSSALRFMRHLTVPEISAR